MLAERVISNVIRQIGRFHLTPFDGDTLPGPPMPGKSLSLYLHVPFCVRLCPYCSFCRYVFQEDIAYAYFDRLHRELELAARLGYRFHSLYVGGGTPTLLPDELARLIDHAGALFDLQEVSTETNPNHLVPEVFDALGGRVDRISVGVQSFDDDLLCQMRRYEVYGSGEEAMAYIEAAADHFDTLNVDLIFNLPAQTPQMLASDIDHLIRSRANQVSFYPLMASPSVQSSLEESVGIVDYSREESYYRQILASLDGVFTQVSGWTFNRGENRLIDEYILDEMEYVGLGPGTFSYLDGTLYANTFSLPIYISRLDRGQMSAVACQRFSRHDQLRYAFMTALFSLRLDKRAFERQMGASLEGSLWPEMTFLRAAGAFERDTPHELVLSERGRYLLVAMMREFFIGVNILRGQARAELDSAVAEGMALAAR
jgi:coproporphyrinogen III oxidase-like Fe-S oxidoreductase